MFMEPKWEDDRNYEELHGHVLLMSVDASGYGDNKLGSSSSLPKAHFS